MIDLPGFGKSDWSAVEFSNPDVTMKFFVFPLITLTNLLKLENIIVIAHSLGGFIASHLCKYIKDKVAAVFIVGAAGFTQK